MSNAHSKYLELQTALKEGNTFIQYTGCWSKVPHSNDGWWALFYTPKKLFDRRLLTSLDLTQSEALRDFVYKHADDFTVFNPEVSPVFLHVFFTDDGERDQALTWLPWEEYKETRMDLEKHSIYIGSETLWGVPHV